MNFSITQQTKHFGGTVMKMIHKSNTLNTENQPFNLFLPPTGDDATLQIPLLIFLAGLTSSADEALEKSNLNQSAAKHGLAVLYPDTSPREHFFSYYTVKRV